MILMMKVIVIAAAVCILYVNVKASVVPDDSEVSTSVARSTQKLNCTSKVPRVHTAVRSQQKSLMDGGKLLSWDVIDNDQTKSFLNCSEPEISIKPVSSGDHDWKSKLIIGCTIAVTFEVVIIIFMMMYWKQIRWTLRKITCPCDHCWPHSETVLGLETRSNNVTYLTDYQSLTPDRNFRTFVSIADSDDADVYMQRINSDDRYSETDSNESDGATHDDGVLVDHTVSDDDDYRSVPDHLRPYCQCTSSSITYPRTYTTRNNSDSLNVQLSEKSYRRSVMDCDLHSISSDDTCRQMLLGVDVHSGDGASAYNVT